MFSFPPWDRTHLLVLHPVLPVSICPPLLISISISLHHSHTESEFPLYHLFTLSLYFHNFWFGDQFVKKENIIRFSDLVCQSSKTHQVDNNKFWARFQYQHAKTITFFLCIITLVYSWTEREWSTWLRHPAEKTGWRRSPRERSTSFWGQEEHILVC